VHALTRLQIRTYDDALAYSVFVQHQNFNRITQAAVIKLIVTNAMESHRRILRHHENRARSPRAGRQEMVLGVRRAQFVGC